MKIAKTRRCSTARQLWHEVICKASSTCSSGSRNVVGNEEKEAQDKLGMTHLCTTEQEDRVWKPQEQNPVFLKGCVVGGVLRSGEAPACSRVPTASVLVSFAASRSGVCRVCPGCLHRRRPQQEYQRSFQLAQPPTSLPHRILLFLNAFLATADSDGSDGVKAGEEGGEAGAAAARDDHKVDVSAIAVETNMVGTRRRSIWQSDGTAIHLNHQRVHVTGLDGRDHGCT